MAVQLTNRNTGQSQCMAYPTSSMHPRRSRLIHIALTPGFYYPQKMRSRSTMTGPSSIRVVYMTSRFH